MIMFVGDTGWVQSATALARDRSIHLTRASAHKRATSATRVLSDSRLAEIAAQAQATCKSEGAVVGMRLADGTEHLAADGRFAPGVPITTNSQCFDGSVTKLYVAALALQLVDKGKLHLDDHVERYLPNWPRGNGITVGMLLSHRSGMGDFANDFGNDLRTLILADPSRVFSYDEVLRLVAARPAIAEPGVEYHYTNADFIVLGAIIQKITHTTLGRTMRTRIFTPLGLHHTIYGPDQLAALAAVTFHGLFDVTGTGTPVDIGGYPRAAAFTIDPAGAGIVTTAPDTLTFIHALYGTNRLLRKASRDFLADHTSTVANRDLLLDKPFDIRGHGGVSPGAQTIAAYDWHSRASVVAWCNRVDLGDSELLASVLAANKVFELVKAHSTR